uniref:Transmembrane protein n=1 Tax=Globodera pallida TaxID=36090 RepID=A0A183CHA2_GLOPA
MSRKIIHFLTPTLTLFFFYLFFRTSSSNVETSLPLNTSRILPTTSTTTEFAKSKVEQEENARLSAALSSLNSRIVQLEESWRRRGDSAELSAFSPITFAQGAAFSFPCTLLTVLTLLLLIITLLIMSNILMIRKFSRGHNGEGAAMGQAKQREKGMVDMDRKGTRSGSNMKEELKPQEVVQLVEEGV